jgi:hypothetical protein
MTATSGNFPTNTIIGVVVGVGGPLVILVAVAVIILLVRKGNVDTKVEENINQALEPVKEQKSEYQSAKPERKSRTGIKHIEITKQLGEGNWKSLNLNIEVILELYIWEIGMALLSL